jgi:hypothetical protein
VNLIPKDVQTILIAFISSLSKFRILSVSSTKERESALIEPVRKGPLSPGVPEKFYNIGGELRPFRE